MSGRNRSGAGFEGNSPDGSWLGLEGKGEP